MDERNLTTEQLRALERWENEGGNVNEQPAPQKLIIPWTSPDWEKADVWPRWSWV